MISVGALLRSIVVDVDVYDDGGDIDDDDDDGGDIDDGDDGDLVSTCASLKSIVVDSSSSLVRSV